MQLAYASERLAARPLKFERSKVCTNDVPHRFLGWTQSGSSSMTGVIFFTGILSVRSDKTFAFAMSSTVQLWRVKNSMFTQGFFCPFVFLEMSLPPSLFQRKI